MSDQTISPSDPEILLAGIKQFGLAADGSDLQDLAAAIARLREAGKLLQGALGDDFSHRFSNYVATLEITDPAFETELVEQAEKAFHRTLDTAREHWT